jgi:hypothetical protein
MRATLSSEEAVTGLTEGKKGFYVMRKRYLFFEAFCLGVLSFVIVLCGFFFRHSDFLNEVTINAQLANRSTLLSQMFIIYGSVIFLTSITSYYIVKMQGGTLTEKLFMFLKTLFSEIKATIRWVTDQAQIKDDKIYLAITIIIGVMVRSFFLAQPMRYDESYTFLSFVNGSIFDLFYYPYPNNHILHTLLVRLSVEIFGSHPVAIRLTAFIAGLCIIPLTFLLNRLITRDSASGYLSSIVVAVFPYLILFDTMARGYSLIVLFSILLSILGFRFLENPSIELCFFISLTIALGLFCIPTFLFPAVGILLWITMLFFKQEKNLRQLIIQLFLPCSIMILVFTGILYTPTIIISRGVEVLITNHYVESLSWTVFINNLYKYFFETISSLFRDFHITIVIALLLLFIVGYFSLIKRKHLKNIMLFPSLLIGAVLVLFFRQVLPPPRVWIYFIPFFLIIADIGFFTLFKFRPLIKSVLIICAIFTSLILMNNNLIAKYPDTGVFTEASTIVEILANEMRDSDRLIVTTPADGPIYFYMWYQDVPNINKNGVDNNNMGLRTFYVIKKSRYSISDLTTEETEKILDFGDAELHLRADN